MSEPEHTPDGHHVVINGRKWRATDPLIPDERRSELQSILMAWRREVKRTNGARAARDGVQAAKVALGERGIPWWEQTEEERRAVGRPRSLDRVPGEPQRTVIDSAANRPARSKISPIFRSGSMRQYRMVDR